MSAKGNNLTKIIITLESNVAKQQALHHVLTALQVKYNVESILNHIMFSYIGATVWYNDCGIKKPIVPMFLHLYLPSFPKFFNNTYAYKSLVTFFADYTSPRTSSRCII